MKFTAWWNVELSVQWPQEISYTPSLPCWNVAWARWEFVPYVINGWLRYVAKWKIHIHSQNLCPYYNHAIFWQPTTKVSAGMGGWMIGRESGWVVGTRWSDCRGTKTFTGTKTTMEYHTSCKMAPKYPHAQNTLEGKHEYGAQAELLFLQASYKKNHIQYLHTVL